MHHAVYGWMKSIALVLSNAIVILLFFNYVNSMTTGEKVAFEISLLKTMAVSDAYKVLTQQLVRFS